MMKANGHMRDNYTDALVLSSCLWIVDNLHPITFLFVDRLKLQRLPKKYCNTIFCIASSILYVYSNMIIPKLDVRVRITHTSFFHIQSPLTSTALHQQETRACSPILYQFEFCTCSHLFSSSITSLSWLWNLFPGMASFRALERLTRSKLYGGWWRVVHMSCVTASCVFRLCGHALSCWRRFSAYFYEGGWMLLKWCRVWF